MPDSFPPINWGSAPFDERDLDALLSGETADIPVVLHQVADALTALRAAPSQAELSGEAMIMAEFSALGLSQPAGGDGLGGSGGPAHTIELRVPPAGAVRRRRARHRVRGTGHPLRTRAGVLAGITAAAVIVAAVAAAAGLQGPIQHLTRPSTATSAAQNARVHDSASPSLQARGAATVPTAGRQTPSRDGTRQPSPASGPSALCRSFFGYLEHPGPNPRARWEAVESAAFQRLSDLADSVHRVGAYCAPYVRDMFPHGIPDVSVPGSRGRGPNSGQGSQGQDPTATVQPSPDMSILPAVGNTNGE